MKSCEQFFYADDVAFSSSAKNPQTIITNLNTALKKYSIYCTKWKLLFNGSKSEAIFFTRYTCARKLPSIKLTLNDCEISWKNQTKYLGLGLGLGQTMC